MFCHDTAHNADHKSRDCPILKKLGFNLEKRRIWTTRPGRLHCESLVHQRNPHSPPQPQLSPRMPLLDPKAFPVPMLLRPSPIYTIQVTITIMNGRPTVTCTRDLVVNLTPPLLRTSTPTLLVITVVAEFQTWGAALTLPHTWGAAVSQFQVWEALPKQQHVPFVILKAWEVAVSPFQVWGMLPT